MTEAAVDAGDASTARSLLSDDSFLLQTALKHRALCQATIMKVLDAVDLLDGAYACLSNRPHLPWSELYVKGMAGELGEDVIVRDVLLSIKKMSSDGLLAMLKKLALLRLPVNADLSDVRARLDELVKSRHGADEPFRSEHDLRHETLRTTVVAQKVEISKQRSSLSEGDAAYSKLVHQTHDILRSYLVDSLAKPQDLFLHELFFYDLKSPHRDVFSPRPRQAIERALAVPHDYLDCTCCGATAEGLSSTQPATAILYQLYLESGALINASDLWSAFNAVVGGEKGEDCDGPNTL